MHGITQTLTTVEIQKTQFDVAVFILRGQPFHSAHESIIKYGLDIADEVYILLGSACKPRDIKNPFTWKERMEMIKKSPAFEGETHRLKFFPIRDSWYSYDFWLKTVQDCVPSTVNAKNVCVIGCEKDKDTKDYLKRLPKQWTQKFIKVVYQNDKPMDATTFRNIYFNNCNDARLKSLPVSTHNFLMDFPNELYESLAEQYKFIKSYDKLWEAAPWKPIFTTTDAVVTCRGHVLMVRRGCNPGKGLLALPGGFLEPELTLVENCIKELKDETGIALKKALLMNNIKTLKEFDYPGRSLRGRTVTYAAHIPLTFEELPAVKGGDDADHAVWISYSDVRRLEESIFEDHLEIIQYFINI